MPQSSKSDTSIVAALRGISGRALIRELTGAQGVPIAPAPHIRDGAAALPKMYSSHALLGVVRRPTYLAPMLQGKHSTPYIP